VRDEPPGLLIERLRRDAERIAARFELRYRAIEAERPNVRRRYGVCFADGTIRIRLRHAKTGRPLKYSSLVSTLCHELAHLRHFNHGVRFRAFYLRVLDWARAEGIYRPRDAVLASVPARSRELPVISAGAPVARARPLQLDLF
jgi:hypothetical protein